MNEQKNDILRKINDRILNLKMYGKREIDQSFSTSRENILFLLCLEFFFDIYKKKFYLLFDERENIEVKSRISIHILKVIVQKLGQ